MPTAHGDPGPIKGSASSLAVAAAAGHSMAVAVRGDRGDDNRNNINNTQQQSELLLMTIL